MAKPEHFGITVIIVHHTAPLLVQSTLISSSADTQYCDGLRGPLVVYDPQDPHAQLYDYDDGKLWKCFMFHAEPLVISTQRARS
jgi:hypothetical protein